LLASLEKDRPAYQGSSGTDYSAGWAVGRIDQRAGPSDNRFSYGTTGAGVNIYVVDGGVFAAHPDFGGRVRAAWTWDANYPAGQDCSGHGTAVASVAAGNDYGVAKGATIWSVRANDCDDWSWSSTLEAGIDWVTGHHIKPAVLNFSYGAPSFWDGVAPGSMHDAVVRAKAAGIFVVVSAGNTNTDACTQSPANAREVMTVGATRADDQRASFSNYGSCVDIFAPGDAVDVASYRGGYALMSGTSFSAPMVAGVAALLYEKYPLDSPDRIHYSIIDGGTESVVGNPGPSSPNLLLYSTLPAPVRASILGPGSVGPQMTCTWTADVRAGRAPFQYRWWGVLSGSTAGLSGRTGTSGWLNLEVRDALGGYSSRSLYVTVDPTKTSIWCQ
jgi:subtilisin family serine protease